LKRSEREGRREGGSEGGGKGTKWFSRAELKAFRRQNGAIKNEEMHV